MHLSTFVTCLSFMSTTGWAQYVLEDDYMADGNFFDLFTFWDTTDPTNGFVAYQDESSSLSQGLINSSTTNVQMRVDSINNTPNGRPSVRITSNKSYGSGLFILDLDHMPGGICGTWPAFWLVGPDWPNQGEIDIIEGVNDQTANDMTLHTADGCSVSNNGGFTGTLGTTNCYVDASGQAANAGCQISTDNTNTYGSGFNDNQGGVYATEFASSAISIYFFPRGSIPSDITNGSPNPSGWGTPLAQFQGSCDIPSMFTNQQIVFDTTFCGDWAGAVWSSGSCASMAGTCEDYVQNNPSAFADAYWSINALKVYSSGGSYSAASASASNTSSSAVSSAWSSAAAVSSSTYAPSQTTFSVSTIPPSSPAPSATTTSAASASSSADSDPAWVPVVTGTGAVGAAPESTAPSSQAWGPPGGHHHSESRTKRHLRQGHKRHGVSRL